MQPSHKLVRDAQTTAVTTYMNGRLELLLKISSVKEIWLITFRSLEALPFISTYADLKVLLLVGMKSRWRFYCVWGKGAKQCCSVWFLFICEEKSGGPNSRIRLSFHHGGSNAWHALLGHRMELLWVGAFIWV